MNRLTAAVVVAAAALLGAASWAAAEDGSATADRAIEPAFSRPSEERKLAFAGAGLVSDVLVKEGDPVKAGQVIAQQDDSEEQVALRALQLDADSVAEINYEKTDLAEKQVVLTRKETLYKQSEDHYASQSEVDEARLAVELAKAQIQVAEEKHSRAVLDAQKQKVKVDHMRLPSPIDGVVQAINTHAGEMADPGNKDGALVVVKNDPLWVVIHPAADRALKLKPGQELQVRYVAPFGSDPMPWQTAKVIYFAPKADAGSKTEEVRLELPNPTGQRSGLAMEVRLPANVAAVAAGTPAAPAGSASGTEAGPALPPLSN